jgi:hypothetical protein
MSQRKHPDTLKIVKIEDESYKPTYIDGVYFICTESSGQLSIYYDKPVMELDTKGDVALKSVERHLIADLRMSPETFRRIATQIHSAIQHSDVRTPIGEGDLDT